jgi:myo-inositol-1(or 4)-monophosphatase
MKETICEAAKKAGSVLMRYFGSVEPIKKDEADLVTEADYASETCILGILQSQYPDANIISEERGYITKNSDLTFVVDPLDGTARFATGMPWFGVIIAALHRGKPVMGCLYLPVSRIMYFSESGAGVLKNDKRVMCSTATDLAGIPCSCAMVPPPALAEQISRNGCASTASLLDYCHVLDGRFGAFIFERGAIWDIAPLPLMLKEAGGIFSDLQGNEIHLNLSANALQTNYPHMGAGRLLHEQILKALRK